MIRKISNKDEINLLLSIVETHSSLPENLDRSKKRLLTELNELGSNRDIYIKLENELPIAMIQIIYNNADNDPDLADSKSIAHVHDLEVLKSSEGQGYGKEMMAFIESEVIKKGIKRLTLGVDSPNVRAVKLYNYLGYSTFKEEEGRVPEERLLLMCKDL